MRCDDVREFILLPARPHGIPPTQSDDALITAHLKACGDCENFARHMETVDFRLRGMLLIEPPLELQASLIALALEHAATLRVAHTPVYAAPMFAAEPLLPPTLDLPAMAIPGEKRTFVSLSRRESLWLFDARIWSVVAAFGLFAAAILQIAGWFAAIPIDVGDIAEGVSILVMSPTTQYLGDLGINIPLLALWSGIGLGLWFAMRTGLIDHPSSDIRV